MLIKLSAADNTYLGKAHVEDPEPGDTSNVFGGKRLPPAIVHYEGKYYLKQPASPNVYAECVIPIAVMVEPAPTKLKVDPAGTPIDLGTPGDPDTDPPDSEAEDENPAPRHRETITKDDIGTISVGDLVGDDGNASNTGEPVGV